LSKKIIHLIKHPNLLEKFGSAARREVETKYDWNKCVIPQYINIYSKLSP